MSKTLMKRMLLFLVGSVGAVVLSGIAFSRGLLSPRGLGVVILMLWVAIFTGFFLIRRKTLKDGGTMVLPPPGASIDAATRRQLLWQIRAAKTMIALMAVGLLAGLREVKNVSTSGSDRPLMVLALLAGLVMNLLITTVSVQTVVRLKKILSGGV